MERFLKLNYLILTKISNLDRPKLEPASLNPFPTCLIPKFVSRIIGGNAKIIVATTRPETLLGDTAICIHPEDNRYSH